jgi:hypothetical protein
MKDSMKYAIKKSFTGLVVSFLAATTFAADANMPAIMPLPQQLELRAGAFQQKGLSLMGIVGDWVLVPDRPVTA